MTLFILRIPKWKNTSHFIVYRVPVTLTLLKNRRRYTGKKKGARERESRRGVAITLAEKQTIEY